MAGGGSAGNAASSLTATLEDLPPWPPSARCLRSSLFARDLSYVVAAWWFKSSKENVADVCRFSFQDLSDHAWNVTIGDVKPDPDLLDCLKQT